MVVLKTTRDVIEALGGVRAVADLCGVGYTAAHNWQQQGYFSRATYPLLIRRLAKLKPPMTAPPSLWRMLEEFNERQAS